MIKNQKVPERAEVICDDNMHLFNAETIAKYDILLVPVSHYR